MRYDQKLLQKLGCGDITPGQSRLVSCPAHEDNVPSLSVTYKTDGNIVLLHCFAGCSYEDIMQAINGNTDEDERKDGAKDGWKSWEAYTGIPQEEWEQWGCFVRDGWVVFTFGDLGVAKIRKIGEKAFHWIKQSPTTQSLTTQSLTTQSTPPLWPIPEGENLAETIWITEGETDCGVLRHFGLPAFAVTKGASFVIPPEVFVSLHRRGVHSVIFAYDADHAGHVGATRNAEAAKVVGMKVQIFPTGTLCDSLVGEKDLRDAYLCGKIPSVEFLLSLLRKEDHDLVLLQDLLSKPIPEAQWLVPDVLLTDVLATLIGPPKSGKSWLALDIGISVASGKPFLGYFTPNERTVSGPVIYVPKEDPLPMLQDRLAKILAAKGLAGESDVGLNELRRNVQVRWPPDAPAFAVSTRYSFAFNQTEIDALCWEIERMAEHLRGLQLVILDPVLRMTSGIDTWRAEEVAEHIFSGADRIRRTFGCTVLLCHHPSRSSADPYGSIGFEAFSENWMKILDKPEDILGKWIRVETRFKSAPDLNWAYRFVELQERYLVEATTDVTGVWNVRSTVQTRLSNRRQAILKLLVAAGESGMTTQSLAEATEVDYCTIRNDLLLMEKDGLVTSKEEKTAKGRSLKLWYALE